MNENDGLALLRQLAAGHDPPPPEHEPISWYTRRNAHRALPRFAGHTHKRHRGEGASCM